MSSQTDAISRKLNALLDSGRLIPDLPAVGVELISLARQPLDIINIPRVAQTIERDPALAARVLRIANSPYYGLSREVSSVGHAVVLIGLEETIQIVNLYILMASMRHCPSIRNFSLEQFWLHTWACAMTAKTLGRPQFLVRSLPGELYLAGLLHDIGKVVLVLHLTEEYQFCLQLAHERQRPLFEIEREILGVDHGVLGTHLMENWNLPRSILDAVGCHHSPQTADPQHAELASLIELADLIACQSGVGASGGPTVLTPEGCLLARRGQSPLADPVVQQDLIRETTAGLLDRVKLILQNKEPQSEEQRPAKAEEPLRPRASRRSGFPVKKALWRRLLDGVGMLLARS